MSDLPLRLTPQNGPRKIAVLVGIDRYQFGVPPLRNAVRDVQAVAGLLKDKHSYEVRLAIDSGATLSSLREMLRLLAGELSPADRLLFYFAGHGIAEELDKEGTGPQGFLLPQDARRDDAGTFFAMTEVQTLLSQLQCRQLLVLLDCCFAGAFRWSRTRSSLGRPATLYRERYERYLRDPAWQVLTSAAADERALDVVAGGKLGNRGEGEENSPFAAALCQGLSGAADLRVDGQVGDGVILVSELHVYLESYFERLEQKLQKPLQKPLLWSISDGGRDKGQFTFLVPGRQMVLPSALALTELNNPYLGLRPYEARDQNLFFGRRAAIDSLYAKVKRQPLAIVVGASGTGKSSLVRAGLMPRLQSQTSPRWLILEPQRPGKDPLSMLSQISGQLHPGSRSLTEAVAAWIRENDQTPVLLIIDQAEELVTLSGASREAVLRELSRACDAGGGQLHVVLTLRSEFEPHFAQLLPAPANGNDAESPRFRIPPMSRQELREAIERPASERVLYFEPPELVDELLDDVADMPGALPLLSFVLSEMYRAYVRQQRQDRTLREEDYRALGGVDGALAQRADAVYKGYASEAEQTSFRSLMLRMVIPGEAARRRVTTAELDFSDPAEQARMSGMREELLKARLLVSDRDSRGREFVEPAHDKLVLGWPQLGRFLVEDKAHGLHFGLIEDAQAWEENHRDRAYLWDRDARLSQALELQRNTPTRLNRLETDFVLRSARNRNLWFIIVVALTLTALTLLGVWLLRERRHSAQLEIDKASIQQESQNAQKAKLSEQAARADTLGAIPGQEVEARLLAVEAYVQSLRAGFLPHPVVEQSLIAAAAGGGFRLRLQLPPGDITDVKFSPDEKKIITVSPDHGVWIWDAETGRPIRRLADDATQAALAAKGLLVTNSGRIWNTDSGSCTRIPETVDPQSTWLARGGNRLVHFHSAAESLYATVYELSPYRRLSSGLVFRDAESASLAGFSPDGTYVLAYPTGTGRLLVWEAAQATVRVRQIGTYHQALREAVFSPDSTVILTGGENSPASLFQVTTGRLVKQLKGPLYAVDHVEFAADGKVFLTVGGRLDHGEETRRGKREGEQDVRLWDRDEPNREPDWIRISSHLRGAGAAAFSPSGEYLAVAQGREAIQVRQTSDLEPVATLRGYSLSPEEADKSQLAFSPTAQRLVSYSASNNIKQVPVVLVWDVRARPKPEKSPEALRVVCRLLRYQPEWQLPQGAFVSKACADEVKDLPDVPAIVPTGQPPADCR